MQISNRYLGSLVALAIALGLVVPQIGFAQVPSQTKIPLIRLYNSTLQDHLYTSSRLEANLAISFGYVIEGEMGYLTSIEGQDYVPVYRFYNHTMKNHFYTTDAQEALTVGLNGFQFEGVIGFMYKYANDSWPNTIDRLFHPGSGDHFYTTNYLEREAAISAGYVWEGSLGARIANNPF